jgi:hypothetical protein
MRLKTANGSLPRGRLAHTRSSAVSRSAISAALAENASRLFDGFEQETLERILCEVGHIRVDREADDA